MLRAIGSDSTEMFEHSVHERRQTALERSHLALQDEILKIFAKSGIFELERESRYQGSSS